MKIPPTELIARLRAAQGDPDTAQLLEAAANRLQDLDIECATLRHGLRLANARIADLEAPAQDERQPEEPKWYEKCGAPAYCAAQGKCDCGIAYRRHRA